MKTCSKCLNKKPLSEFYRLASSKDGHRPDCKACEYQPPRKITAEERFWSKVRVGASDECWEWQSSTQTNNGYGRFWISDDKKFEVAHRFSWSLANGTIPDGMLVLHSCDNPACVNPEHLFLGTHQENMIDAAKKNRLSYAKLTVDNVIEIRGLLQAGELSMVEIAKRFSVSDSAIYNINKHNTWGWVK